MRCRLCGDDGLNPKLIYCSACSMMIKRWEDWAREQARKTGRWPKVAFECGPDGTRTSIDSSGGHPDPNEFQERPPAQLGTGNAVHIEVPQDGRRRDGTGLNMGSNADLAFYLRLKATAGCTGRLSPDRSVMHLYIEPGSEAAKLFVSRMMAKLRGLPPGPAILDQARALGVTMYEQLTDGSSR